MLRHRYFWIAAAVVVMLIVAALLVLPLTSDDPFWAGFRAGFAAALPNL